jgi:hypothetical protein
MRKLFDDGGPVYPTSVYSLSQDGSEQISDACFRVVGMTRRQWLAGMAMQALITAVCQQQITVHPDMIAKDSYDYADAMLEFERQEKE